MFLKSRLSEKVPYCVIRCQYLIVQCGTDELQHTIDLGASIDGGTLTLRM